MRAVCISIQHIIDDVLLSTPDKESHMKLLETVLHRLECHVIVAKKAKCYFMVPTVEYLGHRVDAEGLHCTTEKVEAIRQAKTPTNVSELRTFLGIGGYYSRFIPNLATTFAPLYNLLKHDSKWVWTEECDRAIETVKQQLMSDQILVHYDTKKPISLACDASPLGLGVVISHTMENGLERPIAFASRTLIPAEKNYPQIEKEALGIIFGVTKFHRYLYGRHFHLITDHQPLTAIFNPHREIPTLSAIRLQRWALILMAYDYEIKYRRSEDHGNADMLSGFPQEGSTLATELAINYFTLANEEPVSAWDISEQS